MVSPSPSPNGVQGLAWPGDGNSEASALQFFVRALMGEMWTFAPVQVKACTNSGALAKFGLVDVLPLLHQVDGEGKVVPHDVIRNVPYFRLQGGANAVIVDPQPGDIGLMACAMRDASGLKASQQAGPPGSRRQYDPSDGFYFGGALNGEPTQYLRFGQDGTVELKATTQATLNAPAVTVGSNGGKVGFFGGSGADKATITGALSAVTDANAKVVLTSLIVALTGYDLALDGTT